MTQVSSNQPQEKVSARAAPQGAITARSRSEAHNTGVMKRPYQYVCQRSGTILRSGKCGERSRQL